MSLLFSNRLKVLIRNSKIRDIVLVDVAAFISSILKTLEFLIICNFFTHPILCISYQSYIKQVQILMRDIIILVEQFLMELLCKDSFWLVSYC